MYLESFDKIGNMSDEYSITLNPNGPPVQHTRWNVPTEAKEEMLAQLKEITMQDIITPQVEPTPWVSSLSYPCKSNGTLRVYLNPKNLCKPWICNQHKAPTLKEIIHNLEGSTTYSKLDVNIGFVAIQFTHDSSLLTTLKDSPRKIPLQMHAIFWLQDVQ